MDHNKNIAQIKGVGMVGNIKSEIFLGNNLITSPIIS